MSALEVGAIVHSVDPRDDPETFYVVLETDVAHVSGASVKIAECGREDETVYRLAANVRDATAEAHRLACEAAALAPRVASEPSTRTRASRAERKS